MVAGPPLSRSGAIVFTVQHASNGASASSSRVPRGFTPAALTSPSIRPWRSTAAATHPAAPPGSVAS